MDCHFSPPGDLPNPGIELLSPALQADSLPAESLQKSGGGEVRGSGELGGENHLL